MPFWNEDGEIDLEQKEITKLKRLKGENLVEFVLDILDDAKQMGREEVMEEPAEFDLCYPDECYEVGRYAHPDEEV
jgi:hypothetical protein